MNIMSAAPKSNFSHSSDLSKDLGETWMFSEGKVFMKASADTKAEVAAQAEAAHAVWARIAELLKIADPQGGVIVEREQTTLLAGAFVAKAGALLAAEGELIQKVKPDFDYCFARM